MFTTTDALVRALSSRHIAYQLQTLENGDEVVSARFQSRKTGIVTIYYRFKSSNNFVSMYILGISRAIPEKNIEKTLRFLNATNSIPSPVRFCLDEKSGEIDCHLDALLPDEGRRAYLMQLTVCMIKACDQFINE